MNTNDTGTNKEWPWLPTELYAHILSFLPAGTRSRADPSVKALAACLAVNRQLHAAALQSALWQAHYVSRYAHCVEEKEALRCEEARGDWYVLYRTRRIIDHAALRLVDNIRLQLGERHARAIKLVQEYSFDVWDALELEASLPLPPYFRSRDPGGEEEGPADEVQVPHALPRRYWARAIMGVIARHHTLKVWARLFSSTDEGCVSFEQALAGLSSFFDESPKRVALWITQLADHCRRRLLEGRITVDPRDVEYDLKEICIRIRSILRADFGFRNAEGEDFYDLLNQFPHALMQESHRRTIPMSLVYIFVSVCQRLGISAAPVNFPGKVLCHIADPQGKEMLFDLCNDTPPFVFSSKEIGQMLQEVGLQPDARPDMIRPCSVGTILHRAAANIIIAVRWNQRRAMGSFTEQYAWCSYAAYCIFLLQTQDNHILSYIMDSKPLDALAVLSDVVCPALIPDARASLGRHCDELVQVDDELARTVRRRSDHCVKYFVGLAVSHEMYGYEGCIIGWHPTCMAKEEHSPVMQAHRLARGWEQPFYWIITADGAKRYVAEEHLSPAFLDKRSALLLFENRSVFGRYFEDLQVNAGESRSRLRPSQELQTLFPEDDQAGVWWITDGGNAAEPTAVQNEELL